MLLAPASPSRASGRGVVATTGARTKQDTASSSILFMGCAIRVVCIHAKSRAAGRSTVARGEAAGTMTSDFIRESKLPDFEHFEMFVTTIRKFVVKLRGT